MRAVSGSEFERTFQLTIYPIWFVAASLDKTLFLF